MIWKNIWGISQD